MLRAFVALLLVGSGVAQAAAEPDDLGFCVAEINRYRKKAGKPPLERSAELESFAAAGAASDARMRKPHQHFSGTPFPHAYSEMGENVIPWWPIKQYGSVRDIIRAGMVGMWGEGPGGGHYENLVGNYTRVGCGIFIDTERGEVTVSQDFLRPPDPPSRK